MDPEALRAMLMANRAKRPAPEPSQAGTLPTPVAAEAAEEQPSKRARTLSESEAAAASLLEEMAAELAAEQPPEQAPTDDEALQGAHG